MKLGPATAFTAVMLTWSATASAQSCPQNVGGFELNTTPGPGGQPINREVCSGGTCYVICKYGFNPSLPEFSAIVEWRAREAGPAPQFPGTCGRSAAGNVLVGPSRQAIASWTPGPRAEAGNLARALLGAAEGRAADCPGAPPAPPRDGVDTRNPGVRTPPILQPAPPPPPRTAPTAENFAPALWSDRVEIWPPHPTLEDAINVRLRATDPNFDPLEVTAFLWRQGAPVWEHELTLSAEYSNGYPDLWFRFPRLDTPGEYTVQVIARDRLGAHVSDREHGRFVVARPLAIVLSKTSYTRVVRAAVRDRLSRTDPPVEAGGRTSIRLYEGDAVEMCGWGGGRMTRPAEIVVVWPAEQTSAVVRFDPRASPVTCRTLAFEGTMSGTSQSESGVVEVVKIVAQDRGQSGIEMFVRHRATEAAARFARPAIAYGAGRLASATVPAAAFGGGPDRLAGADVTFVPTTLIEVRSELLVREDAGGLTVQAFEGSPIVRRGDARQDLAAGQEVTVSAAGSLGPVRAFDSASVSAWWLPAGEPDLHSYSGPEWRAARRLDLTVASYPSGPLAIGDGSVSFADGAFIVRSSRDQATFYAVGSAMSQHFEAVATIGSVAGTGPPGAGLYLSGSPTVAVVLDGDVYLGRSPTGLILQIRRGGQWEALALAADGPSIDSWDQFVVRRRGEEYEFVVNGRTVARHVLPGRGPDRVDFFTAPGAVAEMRRWSVAGF